MAVKRTARKKARTATARKAAKVSKAAAARKSAKVSKATAKARRGGAAKEVAEFLVFRVNESSATPPKTGASFVYHGVAGTMEGAKEIIDNLNESGPRRYAIFEKKALYTRRPAVKVELVRGNIA